MSFDINIDYYQLGSFISIILISIQELINYLLPGMNKYYLTIHNSICYAKNPFVTKQNMSFTPLNSLIFTIWVNIRLLAKRRFK